MAYHRTLKFAAAALVWLAGRLYEETDETPLDYAHDDVLPGRYYVDGLIGDSVAGRYVFPRTSSS